MQRSEQEIKLSLYLLNCDHPMQGITRGGVFPMMPYTGIFFRLQVYERVRSSLVKVYKRVGDQSLSFGSVKGPRKGKGPKKG